MRGILPNTTARRLSTLRRGRTLAGMVMALSVGTGIGFVAADQLSSPECVPRLITYEGYLTQNGIPASDGVHQMWFDLYTSPTGGTPVWTLAQRSVTTSDGHFVITLGDTTQGQPAIDMNGFSAGDMYLEVAVDSESNVVGRQRVTSVPYALRAAKSYTSALAERMVDSAVSLSTDCTYSAPFTTCSCGPGKVAIGGGGDCPAESRLVTTRQGGASSWTLRCTNPGVGDYAAGGAQAVCLSIGSP